MSEPGTGEVQASTAYPTWKEILERGWFESSEPVIIGTVPNPDEFKKAERDMEGSTSLMDPQFAPYFKPLIPTLLLIASYEKTHNPLAPVSQLEWDTYIHTLQSDPNTQPHCDGEESLKIVHGSYHQPQSRVRYTIASHQGTDFYPGRYEVEPQKILSDRLAPSTIAGFKEMVETRSKNIERWHTPGLAIVRFDELAVHSSPKIKGQPGSRLLLSVDILPTKTG